MQRRRLAAGVLIIGLLLMTAGSITFAQDETTVTLSTLTLGVGESGVVEGVIACSEPDGCAAFDITIRFDATIVSVDRVETGPYLGAQIFEAENSVDNKAGIVRLAVTALAAQPEFGEPVLLRLTVTGRAAGMAVLNVSELLVSDLAGNPVAAAGIGGVVAVESAPVETVIPTPPTEIPAQSIATPLGSGSGEIAFASNRDGDSEIYIMNADGSNPRNLTNHKADDWFPVWSPVGTQIAFVSGRDWNFEIYIMNADGSNPRNLTDHAADDVGPAWSPDGSHIAFYSDRDGNREIYLMNADGSNPRNLTNNDADDWSPAWSPDGSHIAFFSDRDGNTEIYTINADGSNPRNLTNHSDADFSPTWSPDGTQIAFYTDRDGNKEIYLMNADGSNPRNLTNNDTDDWFPVWSPDGSRIAFVSGRDGNEEIYIMNSDGSNPRNLTNNHANDYAPAWRPASQAAATATPAATPVAAVPTPFGGGNGEIAFVSDRDGNFEIYVMNADGSNPRRLTSNRVNDDAPAWSPDSTQIAFESYREGSWEINVMDADGSNLRRLTNNGATDAGSAWSPDGTQIAFYSDRDGNLEIYVMNTDGSDQHNLTNNSANDYAPAWSPDGSRVAFFSDRDGNAEIYIMNADGSDPRRLTNINAQDYWPAWSPDGSRIAFFSDRDGNTEIYVMNADGSDPRRLTNINAQDHSPVWSPDGTQIAFTSLRDGNYEVYVMNSDGSNQRNLTNSDAGDRDPAWRPASQAAAAAPAATQVAVVGITPTPRPTGFPTDVFAQVQIVQQSFERGWIFGLRHTRQIWVATMDGSGIVGGEWFCYNDTFQEGEPELDPALIPPEGLIQPHREFGKVWRKYGEIRELLGWATTSEFEFVSDYWYLAGGTADEDGNYVPGPGEHRITTFSGDSFSFFEETIRGDCIGGTWHLTGDSSP